MTTEGDAATSPAPLPAKGAGSRQAPADLTLAFVDEANVRGVSAAGDEPEWLLADRLAALRAFVALPIEANPLYTGYVDLRNARLADVRPVAAGSRRAAPSSDSRRLPKGASALAEIGEDGARSLVLSPEARAAGVVLETLSSLGARDPGELRLLLEGGCTLPEGDKLAQLTRALWSDGLYLRIPDGVRLEAPVVLRWIVGTPGTALLSRVIISVGEDAEVSVLEEQNGREGLPADSIAQGFFAGTTEVRVGVNATLSFAGLQDLPLSHVAFQHRSAVVGRGATLRWALAQLGTRVIRSRIDNVLEGDGSTVEQVEIVFGASDQLFDLTSFATHVGRDTTGNLLSKGVLSDRSRAYFKGLAAIEGPAHGTDSYIGEFGMLLSRHARSVAIPSLEIDQPDCRRVAHASSVGPIDEAEVFYLMSRGLDREEARKFIVLGYLEPVVARVPLAEARDRLHELLEARWLAGTSTRASVA
jgi:Fe-S cluster assembly scaffold protein SufB